MVRILDLNDQSAINDRCQALKIIRKILSISKKALPESFLISLISIINCSSKAEAMGSNPIRDKLYRPAIVIVCEIAFIEPLIVIHTGGFRALLGNVWNLNRTPNAPNFIIIICMLAQVKMLQHIDYNNNLTKVNLKILIISDNFLF